MLDDGENLTPLDIQPVTIPHGRWDEFVGGGWQEAVEQLRAQVEQTHEPDPR